MTMPSRPLHPSPPPKGQAPRNRYDGFSPRFAQLKRDIVGHNEQAIIASWKDVLAELDKQTKTFARVGPNMIPQVEFSHLINLTPDEIAHIKRIGSLVIRNVVDDQEALCWKESLKLYVKANPEVRGFPVDYKQFFELYWSTAQIRARSHPNVLALSWWLNTLWSADNTALVDLNQPVTYCDRFRIRTPTRNKEPWKMLGPHIDGPCIERWEDPSLQDTYDAIFRGKWRTYDAYDITGRLTANTDLYHRPNQASVLRTWQGWLSMSYTGPGQGALRLFPDLLLSTTYLLLRPFFRPIRPREQTATEDEYLASENWVFNVSNPFFPGIVEENAHFSGQALSHETHPHLRLDTAVVSAPPVKPGDMVFWHCDVVHAIEQEFMSGGDSSVMYIPTAPLTPQNASYLAGQRNAFLTWNPPPDFPTTSASEGHKTITGEANFLGKGMITDLNGVEGRRAMGLAEFVAVEGASDGARRTVRMANEILKSTPYPQALH